MDLLWYWPLSIYNETPVNQTVLLYWNTFYTEHGPLSTYSYINNLIKSGFYLNRMFFHIQSGTV